MPVDAGIDAGLDAIGVGGGQGPAVENEEAVAVVRRRCPTEAV